MHVKASVSKHQKVQNFVGNSDKNDLTRVFCDEIF